MTRKLRRLRVHAPCLFADSWNGWKQFINSFAGHRKRFRLFGVFPSHSGEFNDVDCRWRKRLRNDRDNCVLCNSFHFEDGFCLPQGLTLQNVITTPFGFAAKNDFVRSAFCVLLYYKKKRINLGLALFDAHLQVIHLHDFASTR